MWWDGTQIPQEKPFPENFIKTMNGYKPSFMNGLAAKCTFKNMYIKFDTYVPIVKLMYKNLFWTSHDFLYP